MNGLRNLLAILLILVALSLAIAQEKGSASTVKKITKLYKFFNERKICSEPRDSRKTFEDFYTLITFKCNWSAFVDAMNDASRASLGEDSSEEATVKGSRGGKLPKPATGTLEIYDIEFTSGGGLTEPRYRTLSAKLFDNFNIRSLRLSNLNIEKVEDNTFDSPAFASYLQTLDLSRNSIRRLDSHTLSNLKSLQYLNLSSNRLSLGESNFEKNHHLSVLDVSNNDLQFLSPRVFANLHELEWLGISRNNIRKIDACTFASVQTSPISAKYAPVFIDLQLNPIDCDCQVFYLSRHLGYKVNLVCDKPAYYKGKTFDALKREDPAYRCEYEKINERCRPHESISDRDFMFLVVAGSLIAVLFIIACCCCCNSIAQSGKAMQLKGALEEARRAAAHHSTKKNIYVTVPPLPEHHDDKQKLIVHDK